MGKGEGTISRFALACALLLIAATMSACDARRDLWYRATDDVRMFITPAACTLNAGAQPLANQKYYQAVSSRWWVNDPCRGAICPPLSAEHPDRYAFGITFVNDQGVPVLRKLWVVNRRDVLAFSVGMSSKSNVPSWLHTPPAGRTGETCVSLTTVPWQKDRNRPFWVADATLQTDRRALQATADKVGLMVLLLGAIAAVGTGIVAIGYFDAPALRSGGVIRCLLVGGGAVAALMFISSNQVSEPLGRLSQAQDYYNFYERLPKAGGALLPLDGFAAGRLFAGPPLTIDVMPSTDTFYTLFWLAVFGWVVLHVKRLYMGLYWLLVPLPLEVRFQQARARGDWPHGCKRLSTPCARGRWGRIPGSRKRWRSRRSGSSESLTPRLKHCAQRDRESSDDER
jgi:hypothetical protein